MDDVEDEEVSVSSKLVMMLFPSCLSRDGASVALE
jgi:hypothetical protein